LHDPLTEHLLNAELWHWLAFGGLVAALLLLDMLCFHRRAHAPSVWESAGWSAFWVGLGLLFGGVVWWWGYATRGSSQAGMTYFTGFIVEKSLSLDNLLVFAMVFSTFRTHRKYQYTVLFWGVLGAIFLRLAMILAGVAMVRRFEVLLMVLGGFLIYSGFRLWIVPPAGIDPERSLLVRLARRLLPVTRQEHGRRFFAREDGCWSVTPLFLVLLVVESMDVLFAVDSVPAILGITQDAFIVFTSNVFAILGLRALYFMLVGVMDRFSRLRYGLSAVLIFIGGKMIAEFWLARRPHPLRLPDGVSLAVICGLLAISMAASLRTAHRGEEGGR
jgi:tellurite resistance protein TerC